MPLPRSSSPLGYPASLLALVLTSCSSWPPECRARPDDDTGYLQPICRYITSNFESYDQDPNEITIKSMTEGTETHGDAGLVYVHLSCCYTGDTAVVKKATKEVVEFRAGAI